MNIKQQRCIEIINEFIEFILIGKDVEDVIEILIDRIGITPEELIRYFNFSKTDVESVCEELNSDSITI